MKIMAHLSIGYSGAEHTKEMDFEDDTSGEDM